MSFPNTEIAANSCTNYNNNLTKFISVTNTGFDVAKHYLNSNGWDINTAISRFFEDRGDSNRNAAPHKEPFNNDQQERMHRKPVRLGSVFTAPTYRFTGSLEDATEKASNENKWILINIQDIQNRGNSHCLSKISHYLNEAIFKDRNLSSVIKKRCILYQWVSASYNAKRVINRYYLSKLPCILLIDPNSKKQYEFDIADVHKANQLKSVLTAFLQQYKPSPVANIKIIKNKIKYMKRKSKIIKNPCVIIIGISDYLYPNHSLPAVKKDIDSMKALWTHKWGYKNVQCTATYLEMAILKKFIKDEAAKLQLNGDNLGIDGLIFIYSGHGDNENGVDIISSDNKKLPLSQIQNIFATTCDCLEGKPKIFYMDCCRGNEEIKENKIKQITKGQKPVNVTYVNPLIDFYVHYASCNNYAAYCCPNEFGSYLIKAIYTYYGDEFDRKQFVDLSASSVIINRMINQLSKGKQTAESSNKLLDDVYIKPNK